jgi:hypothetical protein
MVARASVVQPRNGKRFRRSELREAVGGWGFKQEGVRGAHDGEGWAAADVALAVRAGVPSLVLLLSPRAFEAVDRAPPPPPGGEPSSQRAAQRAALAELRAYAADNKSMPAQMLAGVASAARTSWLGERYGWAPSQLPALGIVHETKLHAFSTEK